MALVYGFVSVEKFPSVNIFCSVCLAPQHRFAEIVLDLIRLRGHDGAMRPFPFLMLLAGVACVACVACAATATSPPRPKPAKAAAAGGNTLAKIRALIGDAACTDSSQCHTLPLGARPCGGPQAYLPWSSAKTDGAALAALGAQYRQEREAAIAASGELSTCRFLPDPGAVCRAGTCQLNPVGADGQSAI